MSFPVVVSYLAIALSVALAGHTTSPDHPPVLAIVTVHADQVPHVVSVIFDPSINCTDPPDADSVTVCDVASEVFVIVWSPVLVPDTVVVQVTARVGVEEPEIVTVFTVVGVIAPRVTVNAPSVFDADTQLAVVTRLTSVHVVAGSVCTVAVPAAAVGCIVTSPDVLPNIFTLPIVVALTQRFNCAVPSVVIQVDTFVSVVPAPSTTALDVSDPAVAVTVPVPHHVAAIVTIQSALVPVVVSVILVPSTNLILPPVADSVAV